MNQIIITCRSDGYIEVYGDERTRVRIIEVPHVEPVDHPLAELYADKLIKWRWRPQGFKRLLGHWIRKVRPSEINQRDVELQILRSSGT